MKQIYTVLAVSILLSFSTATKAQVNTGDSLALVDLYNSTNGPGWYHIENWLTTKPLSTWYGIGVKNNRVDSVDLHINNLVGTIPSSIGNCTGLTYLDFYFNKLTGSIPTTLGNCTSLYYLYLYDNKLTGSIPTTLGNCAGLYELRLSGNQLTGSIPTTLGNCTSLRYLFLDNNQLTGSIPTSFSKLKSCRFYLYNNELRGLLPIPPVPVNNYVSISSNRYNFSAFEASISKYTNLYYTPQKNIPIHKNGNKLSVTAGGTLSKNTYKWYKNNVLIKTATGDSTLTTTGAGKYSATVTNSKVTLLTLQSDTLTTTSFAPLAANTASSQLSTFNSPLSTISPNPATNFINISLGNKENATIKIYDGGGKMIKQLTVNGQQATINISNFAAGIYYAEINAEGIITKQKFIKQ